MDEISRIGMDTSKQIIQFHGVDGAERVVLRRRLKRKQVLPFFAALTPTVVATEACGGAHYWARELGRLGHEVKLPPGEALRQARQERRSGCRSAVRGNEPAGSCL